MKICLMIRRSEDTMEPFHFTQQQTGWHQCYHGAFFQPNICLHNNISEKYPASHAFCINKSSITTKINKLRWHSSPNSLITFTRSCWMICRPQPRNMSSFPLIKKSSSSLETNSHLGWCRYTCCKMFSSVFKLQRYTTMPSWSIQPSVQHMKEQTHPVLLSNTMWLLALSGTSGLLPQVADLKLPLSLTQTQWQRNKAGVNTLTDCWPALTSIYNCYKSGNVLESGKYDQQI